MRLASVPVSYEVSWRIEAAISGLRLALSDAEDGKAAVEGVIKILETARDWADDPRRMQREDDRRLRRALRG